MIRQAMSKNGATLALFAAASTLLVAFTQQMTAPQIAQMQQQEQLATLSALIPAGSYDNDLLGECRLVTTEILGDKLPHRYYRAMSGGKVAAEAVELVAADGYSGAIKLLLGWNGAGEVTAVRVIEHHETPGLGDKIEIKKSNWVESFNGRRWNQSNAATWAVRKDGGEFDAFTGATITPRAVVNAVARVMQAQHNDPQFLVAKAQSACQEP